MDYFVCLKNYNAFAELIFFEIDEILASNCIHYSRVIAIESDKGRIFRSFEDGTVYNYTENIVCEIDECLFDALFHDDELVRNFCFELEIRLGVFIKWST